MGYLRQFRDARGWSGLPPNRDRCADILDQVAEAAESKPEVLARHYTEAGLIEKAAGLWGKAGERSLDRSALAKAAAQFARTLELFATLPSTPALRRAQIKFQVALITPLIHVKGYAAAETKVAAEQARSFIERAQALGDLPKVHCYCSRCPLPPGSRTMCPSMATPCAITRHSS